MTKIFVEAEAFDHAETETQKRKKALFASTFNRLVESNLQLVKTVRTAIVVVTACAVVSMGWSAFGTYSMRGTLAEMRVMLEDIRGNLKVRP